MAIVALEIVDGRFVIGNPDPFRSGVGVEFAGDVMVLAISSIAVNRLSVEFRAILQWCGGTGAKYQPSDAHANLIDLPNAGPLGHATATLFLQSRDSIHVIQGWRQGNETDDRSGSDSDDAEHKFGSLRLQPG